ncbi:unnamed protein product [Mycena citricolor]|uniref:Gylcosyl hydrolase 115 C-terminal domain-containing protein n=1 Tax=Mycena citricolor TaxID=2018698 RepID=A0AAD2H7I8_9AGAR|nr:unnamed protein product [Mycena citricolor]
MVETTLFNSQNRGCYCIGMGGCAQKGEWSETTEWSWTLLRLKNDHFWYPIRVSDHADWTEWIASSQISKIYEQMSIAVDRQATQIWVLNVGDLKPSERETEFFLAYGCDASLWNPDNLDDFVLADEVETLFENDFNLETRYHALLGSKWEHMMDETPAHDELDATNLASAEEQTGDTRADEVPSLFIDQFDPISDRYIDIGAGVPTPFMFTVEVQIFARVDWTKLDEGLSTAVLNFTAFGPDNKVLTVNAFGSPRNLVQAFIVANKTTPSAGFKGFVGAGGAVSFEAQRATRSNSVSGMVRRTLPGLRKTLSGVTPFPRLSNENNFTAGAGPFLEYDFYTFSSSTNVTVITCLLPSENGLGADRPLGCAVQLDNAPVQSNYFPSLAPGLEPQQWKGFVVEEIIRMRNVFVCSLVCICSR